MNKKIAFITEAFMGSTLPLIRQLCKRGYSVDVYYYRREIYEPEACDLDFKASHYGINTIPEENYRGVSEYVNSKDFHIYAFAQMKPFASVPIVKNVIALITKRQAHKAAKYINSRNYDVINLICNYNMDHMKDLLHALQGNVIVSMHEVWDHATPTLTPSPLLAETINKGCKIVVFSNKSKNDIIQIRGVNINNVYVNPFGLFESFAYLPKQSLPESLPKKYILFFGFILPYKGLSVLHKAIELMGDAIGEYKIVIAGKGCDPVLEEIKGDERYVVIPRFIKNGEVATLISKAYAVVCPYLSISQSGIPQTTYPFGTPIIASDLEGFREIISPKFGLLFPSGNPEALANQITHIIEHTKEREEMSKCIQQFELLRPEYNWNNICDKFITIVNE